MSKPDYIYDPDDWEYTWAYSDRGDALEASELRPGETKQFSTLINGPDVFAACVVIDYDEDGSPGEWETRWFDTEDEAKAAATIKAPLKLEK